jgi:cell division protein FtsQ
MERSLSARGAAPPGLRTALPRLAGLPAALGRSLRSLPAGTRRAHRRAPAVLAAIAVAAIVLGGGWLLLRRSSLVAVRDVQIAGVSGPQAGSIDSALTGAARGMTTLDVNLAALRAAVAPFPVVRSLSVSTSFPHGLRITVLERPPVAAVVSGGTRTAVAADGTILGPALLTRSLPTLSAPRLLAVGRRLGSSQLLACLEVIGAGPPPLRAHVASAAYGTRGVELTMGNGLIVYFGDGSHALAKWLALARVLADPGSTGAGYVDVRLPARPAAGFAPGAGPPQAEQQAATATPQPGSESTVSSLAAGLAPPASTQEQAAGQSSGTGGAAAGEAGSETGQTSAGGTSSGSSEAGSEAGTEAAGGASAGGG